VSEHEHTTVKLARALKAVPGVPADMIQRVRDGYYHDFLSPLEFPEIQLVKDLRELADRPATPRNSRPLLRALAKDVINGQYDASKEESDEWARSPEGQETMAAALAGQAAGPRVTVPPSASQDEAVQACADLVGRTGARSFEVGYLHDDVPAAQAGWFATAVYKGAKLTAENKASAGEACDALAARVLSGARCQHCKGLVALSDDGAFAYHEARLATGEQWNAEDAAKAPQCRWTRTGGRWERGCK